MSLQNPLLTNPVAAPAIRLYNSLGFTLSNEMKVTVVEAV
jgi:hypothetical protein